MSKDLFIGQNIYSVGGGSKEVKAGRLWDTAGL
jgi:hypothetical protein